MKRRIIFHTLLFLSLITQMALALDYCESAPEILGKDPSVVSCEDKKEYGFPKLDLFIADQADALSNYIPKRELVDFDQRFLTELAQKKDFFHLVQWEYIANLKERIKEIKDDLQHTGSLQIAHELNQRFEGINQTCQAFRQDRLSIISEIDPFDIKSSRVVFKGNTVSNSAGGIQKQMNSKIEKANEAFYQRYFAQAHADIINFFSDPKMLALGSSTKFLEASGLYTPSASSFNDDLVQRCLRQGQIVSPVSAVDIEQGYDQVLGNLSKILADEILKQDDILMSADNYAKKIKLDDYLVHYFTYAPNSFKKALEQNSDVRYRRLACKTSLRALGEKAKKEDLQLMADIGLTVLIASIPMTFGMSSPLLPYFFGAALAMEAANNVYSVTNKLDQKELLIQNAILLGPEVMSNYVEKVAALDKKIDRKTVSAITFTAAGVALAGIGKFKKASMATKLKGASDSSLVNSSKSKVRYIATIENRVQGKGFDLVLKREGDDAVTFAARLDEVADDYLVTPFNFKVNTEEGHQIIMKSLIRAQKNNKSAIRFQLSNEQLTSEAEEFIEKYGIGQIIEIEGRKQLFVNKVNLRRFDTTELVEFSLDNI